jgi:hypothetical protein
MVWAKKNYDSLILGVCAALLVLTAVNLYFSDEPPSPLPTASATSPSQTINSSTYLTDITKPLENALAITKTPHLWEQKGEPSKDDRPKLLVSRSYILKDDKLVDPLEEVEPLHPPITNKWIKDNELDFTSIDLKKQDPDGDGFTNLEEFNENSDPNDKLDTPPKLNKILFVKFEQKAFPLVFKSYNIIEIKRLLMYILNINLNLTLT